MNRHAHAVDDGARPGRPHAAPARRDDHRVLALQRAAGNRAVVGLLQPDAVPTAQPTVQRCGGEVHDGCACAGEGADHSSG